MSTYCVMRHFSDGGFRFIPPLNEELLFSPSISYSLHLLLHLTGTLKYFLPYNLSLSHTFACPSPDINDRKNKFVFLKKYLRILGIFGVVKSVFCDHCVQDSTCRFNHDIISPSGLPRQVCHLLFAFPLLPFVMRFSFSLSSFAWSACMLFKSSCEKTPQGKGREKRHMVRKR